MTFSLKIGENHLFKIRGILFVKHFEIKFMSLFFSITGEKKWFSHSKQRVAWG